MDPNTTLEDIRRLVKLLATKPMLAGRQAEAALDLAEQVEALDEWISGGGFLPKAWRRRYSSL